MRTQLGTRLPDALLALLAASIDNQVPRRTAILDLFESGSDESTVAAPPTSQASGR